VEEGELDFIRANIDADEDCFDDETLILFR
jgi:hypothetical protein